MNHRHNLVTSEYAYETDDGSEEHNWGICIDCKEQFDMCCFPPDDFTEIAHEKSTELAEEKAIELKSKSE